MQLIFMNRVVFEVDANRYRLKKGFTQLGPNTFLTCQIEAGSFCLDSDDITQTSFQYCRAYLRLSSVKTWSGVIF